MKIHKKGVVAVLVGVAVAGALSASATTLGGIATSAIGADKTSVASPVEKGVVVHWDTTYSATAGAYVVNGVELSTADPSEQVPAHSAVALAVSGANGLLGEFTSTNGGTTWTAPAQTILAQNVTGVAVVINGDAVEVQA